MSSAMLVEFMMGGRTSVETDSLVECVNAKSSRKLLHYGSVLVTEFPDISPNTIYRIIINKPC